MSVQSADPNEFGAARVGLATPGGRSRLGVGGRPRLGTSSARAILPGLAAAGLLAAFAMGVGHFLPVVGAPVIAIVCGIVVSLVRPRAAPVRSGTPTLTLAPGLTFTSRRVLQAAVVLLGFELSLGQVLSAGVGSLPVLLGTLTVALTLAWVLGRALRLRRDLNALIGVGTAICGASAIAAADAVIDADDADVSYAIATIFTFNVIAVLLYPTLGHLLGLSQHSFGLWAGTAINDVSSVVAAGSIYGHAAATYGVIVKLTRTLMIIPICLALAALWKRRARSERLTSRVSSAAEPDGAAACDARRGLTGGGRLVTLRRTLPLFIVAFLAAVALNSTGVIGSDLHHLGSTAASWMITAALAAIGLSTDAGRIRRAGLKPLALGAILWASVGLTSLGLQLATGSL